MSERAVTLVDLVRELSALPSGLKVGSAVVKMTTDAGNSVDYTFPGGPTMRTRLSPEARHDMGLCNVSAMTDPPFPCRLLLGHSGPHEYGRGKR